MINKMPIEKENPSNYKNEMKMKITKAKNRKIVELDARTEEEIVLNIKKIINDY